MRALLVVGLFLFSFGAFAQTEVEPTQTSAMKPSAETYSDVNTFDRNPSAVDPGPVSRQSEEESQKIKQPTKSQNMPVDQD
jgi:hypothetical protein